MKSVALYQASPALSKLCNYGYLPAKQMFYLCSIKDSLFNSISAYEQARNQLLKNYGQSKDGVNYTLEGENAQAYKKEMQELDAQEVGIQIPLDKLILCIEKIDQTDKFLPPEKQLGFSANDWISIQNLITVVEKEE